MKQAIICVDDEDIILEALKDQLGPFFENHFLIETSTTAEEALEIYDELVEHGYEVPVVISDYLMPTMRGDEFLIKIHEKNPNILKILLTGHANIEGITNAINNANLYRFSPFSGMPPGLPWLVWCVIWIVGALAVGILLLRRREL